MADEARIRTSLRIESDNLRYITQPTAFLADVAGSKGPVPGAVTVAQSPGTSIDLSELTAPGLCRMMNLDDANSVDYGIWNPDASEFYAFGKLLSGEFTVLRFSDQLQAEVGAGVYSLRFVANVASCYVLVEAFEV